MANTPKKAGAPIRLRHIAEKTGLSLGTISKALNGRTGVSPENRALIQQAMSELGFQHRPPMLATENPISSIAVLAYRLAFHGDLFYESILQAMAEEAEKLGITLEVQLLARHPQAHEFSPASLFPGKAPEAIIMLGIDHPPILDAVAAIACPAILVNGMDTQMRFDSIAPDYFIGSYLATQFLLDQGHRDIMHIGTSRRLTMDLRRQGFMTALAHAGIRYDSQRHFIDVGMQDFSTLDENWLRSQVIRNGKPAATAFFAVADAVAMSLAPILNEAGYQVPQDVSIMGFDDLSVSAHFNPPLTTMNSKRAIIGQRAIQMLLDRVAHPQKEISRISTEIDLIIRQSTATAPHPQ